MSSPKNSPLADTADMPALGKTPNASAGVGRVHMDCAALSHKGYVRPNNEDHYLVARFGRFLTPLLTNVPGQSATLFEEEGHGMVVADGMGGAAAGELASNLAIRTLIKLVIQTPDWIISPEGTEAERVMKRMADRYRRIDDQLLEEAAKNPRLKGMGTTMTLACNVGDCLVLTHIGDSRAYLFRAGMLHQLTHDHTVAQALVDQGLLERTKDAALRLQHALVRVLGGLGHTCEADVNRLMLFDQDVILLCTDGLTDMVDDPAISAILAAGAPPSEACTALVERALQGGGKDNVTVVVARYDFLSQIAA
jgi:serine/threonine protein phosphatase PrpC